MRKLLNHARERARVSFWREQLRQAIRLNDTPERIARGVAVGVFLGVFPTFGLGAIPAVVGSRFLGYNMVAALAGIVLANPLTSPIFITASAVLGSLITGQDWQELMAQIEDRQIISALSAASLTYLVGNLILSTALSLPTYLLAKRAVLNVRQRNRKK
ncbi:MAG: DUF2062 domain-containing protein [Chloroflexi bacterium]|nr:DUF2062 domain-containing protein [Chloroflexota bacterium]